MYGVTYLNRHEQQRSDVTVSVTSSLLQRLDVGLLYHGTIPDYGRKRERLARMVGEE